MATEFTKLVFKEEKNSLLSDPPEGTKPKYMIFFSSEPFKQAWPIILISTDIHSDKVRKRSWAVWTDEEQSKYTEIRPHQIYFLFFGFCAKNVGASKWFKNVNFFSFFCLFVIFDERNVKYYAENIFLIFFM